MNLRSSRDILEQNLNTRLDYHASLIG